MTRTARRTTLLLAAAALIAAPAAAQEGLTVKQKTTYSLGRLGGGELTETVQLLGDRQKTTTEGRIKVLILSRDAGGTSIVRLDEGNVYTLDTRRRQYQVASLADMRTRMERETRELEASAADLRVNEDETRVWVEAEPVLRTGERRSVNGFATEQVLVRMTVMGENRRTGEQSPLFYLTADLWMDPSQTAAARASRDFSLRWAEALGLDPRAAGNPFGTWLKELYRASETVDGYPIVSEFRMEAPAAEGRPSEGGDAPGASTAADPVGAVLGGLARRAARPRQDAQGPTPTPGRSLVFHSTTEVLSIGAGAIATAEFEVPEGFRRRN
jgi:hypothetical protein